MMPHLYTRLLLLAVPFALSGCDKTETRHGIAPDGKSPTQMIERSQIILSNKGRKNAVISAGQIQRFENSDDILLSDSVRVEVFDSTGAQVAVATGHDGTVNERTKKTSVSTGIVVTFARSKDTGASVLRAQRAEADNANQRLTAAGNVRIVSDASISVTTDSVIWDGATRNFRAPGRVRLTNGPDVEQGENLQANSDLSRWTMDRVRGYSTRAREELENPTREGTRR